MPKDRPKSRKQAIGAAAGCGVAAGAVPGGLCKKHLPAKHPGCYNARLHDQLGGFLPALFFCSGTKRSRANPIHPLMALGQGRDTTHMSWQQSVEQTVTGMGFDLVDLERSVGGLLRVTIDWPWVGSDGAAERSITVEDCERVTRQLQLLLEVEAVEYKRLEVGSPGIDRPLRHAADFERFLGSVIDVTLKQPIGAAAAQGGEGIAANRKKFRGTLERAAAAETVAAAPDAAKGAPAASSGSHWQIVWREEPVRKPGQRVSKKAQPLPLQVLGFELAELREARLAPIVNFKGRSATAPATPSAPEGGSKIAKAD